MLTVLRCILGEWNDVPSVLASGQNISLAAYFNIECKLQEGHIVTIVTLNHALVTSLEMQPTVQHSQKSWSDF